MSKPGWVLQSPLCLAACAAAAWAGATIYQNAATIRESDQAHLVVLAGECDLGPLKQGDKAAARFAVRNAGGRRLVLRPYALGCACTTATQRETIVPAGSRGEVAVKLDTQKLRGRIRRECRYQTSDPSQPLITLTILADVAG